MSDENVALVRFVFETFLAAPERGGYDEIFDLIDVGPLDPEVEWDPREVAATFGVPDIDQVYFGLDGGKAFWKEWLSAWEAVTVDYELIDAGDEVVALLDQQMTGRTTGIDVRLGKYAQVWTFRGGLLTRWKCYGNQKDALEATGLEG